MTFVAKIANTNIILLMVFNRILKDVVNFKLVILKVPSSKNLEDHGLEQFNGP